MTSARDVLRAIDQAEDTLWRAPVVAVRLANKGGDCRDLIHAFNCVLLGAGGFDVPRDAGRIRKRAKASRKRNRAARRARRANRR